MRIVSNCALWLALLWALDGTQAYAQQARKWVEPDGRATYSDVPPSKTAPLVGSVKGDSQPAGAGEKIEAGKVELVEGQVSVTGADSKPRNILTGSILLEGDSVSTGEKGELHAEMADGAVIAVRPNSQIRIVRCRARGNSADTSALNLLKGSFRSVTCWIGKSSPASCQIRTPSAAIGVRGTDHEPLVIPAGAASGEPGTYDRVNIGTSNITGANGAVDVTSGRAGFFAQHGRDRPRVLDQVPPQFRATRNESRLQGRRERTCRTRATRHPASPSDSGACQATRSAAAIQGRSTQERKVGCGAGKTALTCGSTKAGRIEARGECSSTCQANKQPKSEWNNARKSKRFASSKPRGDGKRPSSSATRKPKSAARNWKSNAGSCSTSAKNTSANGASAARET